MRPMRTLAKGSCRWPAHMRGHAAGWAAPPLPSPQRRSNLGPRDVFPRPHPTAPPSGATRGPVATHADSALVSTGPRIKSEDGMVVKRSSCPRLSLLSPPPKPPVHFPHSSRDRAACSDQRREGKPGMGQSRAAMVWGSVGESSSLLLVARQVAESGCPRGGRAGQPSKLPSNEKSRRSRDGFRLSFVCFRDGSRLGTPLFFSQPRGREAGRRSSAPIPRLPSPRWRPC
jgi:hypothetical protein